MSFPHAWERLPGPADWLAAIVEDLCDRSSVLAGLPGKMSGSLFAMELAELIKPHGIERWEPVRSDEARKLTPSDSLARRSNGGNSEDFVLSVDATGDDDAALRWAKHVRTAAGIGKNPRVCVAMSVDCACECHEDTRMRRRVWRDFVTASDSRVLTERHIRRSAKGPAYAALKSAVVAELAGPDLPLAETLGREALHHLLDGNRHPPEQIWAAQVAILFPLIDRQRRHFLKQYKEYWRLPYTRVDGAEIETLMELEIGDLAVQARTIWRSNDDALHRLNWLRQVRNDLAHHKVVTWETLTSPPGRLIVDFRE